jgi:hypothetical protein
MATVHIHRPRRTYRWFDKDPIIDAARTMIGDEKLKLNMVHQISGVSATTLDNWFHGDTRKPQNDTLTALSSSLGYVRHDHLNRDGTVTVAFEKVRDLNYRKEIEKQANWLLKHGTPEQKKAVKKKTAKIKTNGHAA